MKTIIIITDKFSRRLNMRFLQIIKLWMMKLLDAFTTAPACIDSHKWETKIEIIRNLSRKTP